MLTIHGAWWQARYRAMHRERVADKLQEKLERVNHMEDRRSVLMDHLAALRADISELDAEIRVRFPLR